MLLFAPSRSSSLPFFRRLSGSPNLRRASATVGMSLLIGGCAMPALPKAAYREVDVDSPEFKAAVAQETARLAAGDRSASAAEKAAIKIVTQRTVQAEKEKRTAQVAPLVRALQEFEKPRGCWAYTSTTTTRKADKVTIDVEHFDPFQPESRLWTLLSRDGRTPDEAEQADYRAERLKRWKRNLARTKKRSDAERVQATALFADFSTTSADDGRSTEFAFVSGRVHLPVAGGMESSHSRYVIENTSGQLLSRRTSHGAAAFFATMKADYFDAATEFIVIDPALPPFPKKTTLRHHLHVFGVDQGEVEIETTYADYRRVKCYDDRFEVQIGAPQVQDFLPARE